VFEEGARREIAAGTFKSSRTQVNEEGNRWPPDAGEQHALGRYIVRATCAECHGLNLQGGQPTPEATPRPDLRAVMSAYDAPAFERLLRTGKAVGDRELKMMSDVARGRYSHLTATELNAVRNYLTAVQ
jgi:mono/diheme cytochrome c family protein